MNSAKPAKIVPANNRVRKDAGRAASGPGGLLVGHCGLSTPIPADLRGGPPRRPEDASGFGSSSHFRNSYGIEKCYPCPLPDVQKFGGLLLCCSPHRTCTFRRPPR